MAKGSKTGGRDFPPGQSGNPAGRPPLPEELKLARSLNQIEFERVAHRILKTPWGQLVEVAQNRETEAFAAGFSAFILKIISTGDPARMTLLLDRLIGTVKKKVEVSGDEDNPLTVKRVLTKAEKKAVYAKTKLLAKHLQILNED